MTRWYRAYEGTVSDPKLHEAAVVAGVSRSVAIAAWHAILEACAGARDGAQALSARRLAVILGETVDALSYLLAAFDEVGLVVAGRVAAWDKRQYSSDTSTDRVRRHREAKGNAHETFHERCETEVKRSASVSVSKEPTQSPPSVQEEAPRPREARKPADWPDDYRERFWEAYPRKTAKPDGLKALDRLARSGKAPSFDRLLAGIEAMRRSVRDKQFIPHPATWLNGERWDDEELPATGPPPLRLVNAPTIDQHGNPIHDQRPRSARAQYTDAFAAGLAEAERALGR